MPLWMVEFHDDTGGPPQRVRYIRAETQTEASSIAVKNMMDGESNACVSLCLRKDGSDPPSAVMIS